MAGAAEEERAIVLDDWPQPAAGAPEPRLLANDHSLSLLFRAADDRFAVVHFPHCTLLVFGAPNDEALGGHPLSKCGLRHYSVHEIVGSKLIRELERRNSVHPRHDPDLYLRGKKHYVITFEDGTLECVAAERLKAPSIEVFEREEEAERSWRSMCDV
jgi:hypothetical protein